MAGDLPPGTTFPRGLPPLPRIYWPLVPARELFELKYGKALVEGDRRPGNISVYGTNGRCGTHDSPLFSGPGVILGRKGQGPLGVEWSKDDYWVIDTAYSLTRVRPDVDLKYAYFLLKFIGLNHLKDGTSNPTLSRDAFGAQALPLPPLAAQRDIAHILGTLDDKIELNRRMNETLEAIARALFKSWFVDFDPVRAKAEGRDPGLPKPLADLFPDSFEDSEFGEVPTGWTAGRFRDLCDISRQTVEPMSEPGVGFTHFSLPAYDEGRVPRREPGGAIKSLKFVVPAGSVLLSKLNPEISRVWLPDLDPSDRAICSTEFLVLMPKPPYGRYFVASLAQAAEFRRALESLVTGTSKSHQRAQPEAILNLAVTSPFRPVLDRFEELAGALLGAVAIRQRESRTLAALRDTLLPKLVSGELRLKDAERIAERTA